MSTLILPAPTGDLPDETPTLDVDALRKSTIRDLLDLAWAHDLPWPRDVQLFRFGTGREYVSLSLVLDVGEVEAHAAWANALYLNAEPDRGHLAGTEPLVTRTAGALGALAGIYRVQVTTHLYPARGLPEQGPRPDVAHAELAEAAALAADAVQAIEALAEPVAVATAALTPDDPSLPDSDPWAGLPVAAAATEPDPHVDHPSFAGQDVTCDRCGKTYRCTPAADYYCAVEGDHCCEPCLIYGRPLATLARLADTERVERPAGEEWADWDAAEIGAVRSAYIAEYGPEIEAEAGGESA